MAFDSRRSSLTLSRMWLAADFGNPILWAVVVGWILTVTLHELGHGIVAHLGGDYTIRERGGLSLNPLNYVNPLTSIILPTIFLLMGGIPLPGGATFVRMDLLRSRVWQSAVSAAGPATSLLVFFALCIPLNPRLGWIDPAVPVQNWSNGQVFVGAMAFLQLLSVYLNLIPVPPLDGFGIISPFLKEDLRLKLTTPPLSTMLFFGYFMLIFAAPGFFPAIVAAMKPVIEAVGVDFETCAGAFNAALFAR